MEAENQRRDGAQMTRLVSIHQITAGPIELATASMLGLAKRVCKSRGTTALIYARQIADAAGGDVYEPINGLEAGLAEALRRSGWAGKIQVEVVT